MIGKKLRLLRVEKGETIVKAAKSIGISKSSLSAYETGNQMISDSVLEKIASHYGVTVEDVLGKSSGEEEVLDEGIEKLCPLKVKEVKHPKTGDTTKWFLPCMKDKCMAYGKDGFCRAFSEK